MRRLWICAATTLALGALAAPADAQKAKPPAHARPAPAASPTPPPPASDQVLILKVEQLGARQVPAALVDQMRGVNTLAEVEELLKANDVQFAWRRTEVDSSKMSTTALAALQKLQPGDVFIFPQGEAMFFNALIGSRMGAPSSFTSPSPPAS